jgi:PPOX class probable F420-dependent enzyme
MSSSGRAAIAMTPEEVAAFLQEERTLICASLGRDGWPHLMPLWYVLRDGECWSWTYAKSQKVRNLERDPRCTVEVEAGERYDRLRGVMMRCTCTLHRDLETVEGVAGDLAERYFGGPRDALLPQAPKRVAMQFVVRDIASWDHRKL